MMNKANEMIDRNKAGTKVKSELKIILRSLDEIIYKDQVEIEPNETFNVSQEVYVLSIMKVHRLRISLLS